ncbi:UNVERIFIED_CONTAM: hypothetical protein FKN15_033149 [Acipenser sinensis]
MHSKPKSRACSHKAGAARAEPAVTGLEHAQQAQEQCLQSQGCSMHSKPKSRACSHRAVACTASPRAEPAVTGLGPLFDTFIGPKAHSKPKSRACSHKAGAARAEPAVTRLGPLFDTFIGPKALDL